MLSVLFLYFTPLWITVSYYLVKGWKSDTINRIFHWFLQAFALLIIATPFLVTFGIIPNLIGVGFDALWTWFGLFVLSIGILKWKGYSEAYCIFMGILVMFLATEVWEIPTHILTISMNSSVEQILKTFMLSSPYLILMIPLTYEFKKKQNVVWNLVPLAFLILPIVLGLMFPFCGMGFFQSDGYFNNDFNARIRILFSALFVMFLLGFPKVKKVESGNGNT